MNHERIHGVERYKSEEAFLALFAPTAPLLVTRLSGARGHGPLVVPLLKASSNAVRSGQAWFFHDWYDLEGYESEARARLTEWTLKHKSEIVCSHILLRSKLVSMGVEVANLALGGSVFRSYTDRSLFVRERRIVLDKLRLQLPPQSAFEP